MDFKDMSFTDLVKLQKALNKEIEDRRFNKSDICDPKLRENFENELTKEAGLDLYTVGDILSKFDASVYRICDITLGNYEIKTHKSNEKTYTNGKYIAVNGSRICIQDPNIYAEMAKDIYNVVRKYRGIEED